MTSTRRHIIALSGCLATRAAPLGSGRRPQPCFASSRFRFCPAAISSASLFTRYSRRRRNRREPCHSLASANSGSTHTLRLRIAFSYADVWW
jgi:hypothetical protein